MQTSFRMPDDRWRRLFEALSESGTETPYTPPDPTLGFRILEVEGIPENTMLFVATGPDDEKVLKHFGVTGLAKMKVAMKQAVLVENIGTGKERRP